MVKSFKTNILTWLKTKTYIKTEIDNFLNGKADSNHKHNDASIFEQIDSIYSNLPVGFMIKNGWCIVQWENPIVYLINEGVNVPTDEWFEIGHLPIPQTGHAIYQQLTSNFIDFRIQITFDGYLLLNTPNPQIETYGTLVYPTADGD